MPSFTATRRYAEALAEIPTYYIMDLDKTMPETVAPEMPPPEAIAGNAWLPDAALAVCVAEYQRTGFQGGLQWYRVATSVSSRARWNCLPAAPSMCRACCSGKRDWGVFQSPGAYERMKGTACTDMRSCRLIEGAGHWPQQEKPAETLALLQPFLKGLG